METLFTKIYETNAWGSSISTDFDGNSGGGSAVNSNITTYIPFLRSFITDNQIKSVVDLGCGDFRCGPHIYDDLDVSYFGYDTYEKVITCHKKTFFDSKKYTFCHLDFSIHPDEIVGADLCILKDVLQHWENFDDIYRVLDSLTTSKKFKYIMIVNCSYQDKDGYKENKMYGPGVFRPLSARFLPLQKYTPTIIYKYGSKEVSIIRTM